MRRPLAANTLKNLFEVKEMFLMVLAENENVVKVNENEGEGSEKGIHEALESLSSIFETERHEMEFKESEWSDNRRL
jgi:hypothetical protein